MHSIVTVLINLWTEDCLPSIYFFPGTNCFQSQVTKPPTQTGLNSKETLLAHVTNMSSNNVDFR